jgi:hypothetical protein
MGALNSLNRALRRFAWPLLTVLALSGAGCTNPFEPATPEPPDPGGVPEDFSSPERLLATMELAIEDKGSSTGRLAWANAMADSTAPGTRNFVANHDPDVLSAWVLGSPVPPPSPWTLYEERRFYDKFVTVYPKEYTMTFSKDDTSPLDDIKEASGTATLYRRYNVTAKTSSSTAVIAIGFVELVLVKYDGRWWVLRWGDRLDETIGVDPADSDNRTFGWRRLDSVSS